MLKTYPRIVGDCPDFAVGHHPEDGRGAKWNCPLLRTRISNRFLGGRFSGSKGLN